VGANIVSVGMPERQSSFAIDFAVKISASAGLVSCFGRGEILAMR
jgi:hypothetical protein